MKPLFELPIDLAGVPPGDVARTLHRLLRSAILDGRLRPGGPLPPSRNAYSVFGVSRTTLVDIYLRLASEGLVSSMRGSGTFVADPIPRPPSTEPRRRTAAADGRLNSTWTDPAFAAAIGFWRDRPPAAPSPDAVDFRPALVDQRLFPFDLFRQSTARQLRRMETKPATFKSPQGNQGAYQLRRAIADHLALMRAVACHPDDLLVTSGAQQAFDLLARTLVTPDRQVVAVEDPGYPPLRAAFIAAGARVVPVRVDDEGLVVDEIPDEVAIVCVCPSHHFPLGMAMSQARRKALVRWAKDRGAVIVEDDYDGEFRHGGMSVEALRSGDAADLVFYVGTFSKCMLPSMRLGYIVAPDWAVRTLTAAKNCLDWHCSVPLQLGVAAFIADGHLARHVSRMRATYSMRREVLLAEIERLGLPLKMLPSTYGMHVAAGLDPERRADQISDRLIDRNVSIHSLTRYYLAAEAMNGFVFGIGASDPDAIIRGLSVLVDVID